jgi:hypothetical protein
MIGGALVDTPEKGVRAIHPTELCFLSARKFNPLSPEFGGEGRVRG